MVDGTHKSNSAVVDKIKHSNASECFRYQMRNEQQPRATKRECRKARDGEELNCRVDADENLRYREVPLQPEEQPASYVRA